jgi:hypothetical protein
MTVTKLNYKTLKPQVEGKRLDQLELSETYTALCYLTHRIQDEPEKDRWWTMDQIRMVRNRQRELLAAKGIYVLTC